MANRRVRSAFCVGILGLAFVVSRPPVFADGGAVHRAQQAAPIQLGCTGGSVRDITRSFCCSGTLGALVTKNNAQYILSNSHVLALSGKGLVGDDISHAGYIDANCQVRTIVGDLSAHTLGGCCDAAIAQVRAGQVDVSGSILDIGVPCTSTATPALTMPVQKSGRTTGRTTGTITVVSATVSVRYPKNCGSGGGTVKTFTGQFGVGSSSFSAGGDSGSVIFDQNDPEHAVGLLFAGSSTTTFANPISSVLATFGVSMVGSACLTGHRGEPAPYTEEELAMATAVLERNNVRIMRKPLILGHGVGLNEDGELVLKIFVEKLGAVNHGQLFLEGYPVEFVDLGGPIYFLCGAHPE